MLIPSRLKYMTELALDEQTRYAINGVHLKRKTKGDKTSCVAAVTDGRCLLVAKWSEPENVPIPVIGNTRPIVGFEAIVGTGQWNDVLGATPCSGRNPLYEYVLCVEGASCSGTDIHMVTSAFSVPGSVHAPRLKGHFPNYEQVIPDNYDDISLSVIAEAPRERVAAVSVYMGIEMLKDVLAAIEKIVRHGVPDSDAEAGRMRMTIPSDPNMPVVLTAPAGDGVELTAVVMPCTGW